MLQAVTAIYRRGLPPVLQDLSFSLPAGASCGVVGRTGSGKSSLMLTLFRRVVVWGWGGGVGGDKPACLPGSGCLWCWLACLWMQTALPSEQGRVVPPRAWGCVNGGEAVLLMGVGPLALR